MWWFATALALAPGDTEVLVERLTPPMHWFDVAMLDVEYTGYTIGVPVDGGEPVIWTGGFPWGHPDRSSVPKDLRDAAKLARKLALQGATHATSVRVTYLETSRWARVCDQAVVASGLLETGIATVALDPDGARIVPTFGAAGGGGGSYGCTGYRLPVPVAEGGRSVLLTQWDRPGNPSVTALLAELPAALADLSSATWATLPVHPLAWPTDAATDRVTGTRVAWLGADDGFLGETITGGLAASVPEAPPGAASGVLQLFATDVPIGHPWTPEAAGYEILWTGRVTPGSPAPAAAP